MGVWEHVAVKVVKCGKASWFSMTIFPKCHTEQLYQRMPSVILSNLLSKVELK